MTPPKRRWALLGWVVPGFEDEPTYEIVVQQDEPEGEAMTLHEITDEMNGNDDDTDTSQ